MPPTHITIHGIIASRSGEQLPVVFQTTDPREHLEGKILQAVHAYAFYGDKLVVVYSEKKKYWSPPGGGIEPGETYEEAVVREVLEETNMRVLHQELIGYIDITEPTRVVRQVRSFCIVEPVGPFVADADHEGDVTEIACIDPAQNKEYFDWKEIGDWVMARALVLRANYAASHGA